MHNMYEHPMRQIASWCAVMIRQPESWTHRALQPDWQWESLTNDLLVDIFDATQLNLWTKTEDGWKGKNKPPPYPRPKAQNQTSPKRKFNPERIDELLALPRVGIEN